MKKIKRRIIELDLELVEPNPSQPREDFTDEDIAKLAVSVDKEGLQNLTVIESHPEHKGYYQIISGERRWRGLKLLASKGRADQVQEFMFIEAGGDPYLMSVVENKNRKSLNPIEEARMIVRLRNEPYKMTWADIADLLGESTQTIQNRRRLLDFPDEIQEMVRRGKLPAISTLNLMQFSSDKARMLKIAHDLAEGRDAPELHLRNTTAHGQKTMQAKLPTTPEGFADRFARLLGRVQSMPVVVLAFMELPKEERAKAIESLDPSTRGKVKVAIVNVTSALRMLAADLGIRLSKEEETEKGEKQIIPEVSYQEALWVLQNIIGGQGTSLKIDLGRASLAKKLNLNGNSPVPLVIGSFRFLAMRWGNEVPRGTSVARTFMLFAHETRRRLGSPKFRRALSLMKSNDSSSDQINLDLV